MNQGTLKGGIRALRRMVSILLSAVFLILSSGAPVWAQSVIVEDIVVNGNARIEDATIETYLTVGRGDLAGQNELDDSLKRLFASGLFNDVNVDMRGNTIVVNLVENPIINRIAFEGNQRLSDEELVSEVRLRERVVFTRPRVQTAVTRVLELYRRNGRYATKVEPRIIELDQNRVDLVFEIEEGPRTTVSGISFIGNQNYSDTTLRSVIQTQEAAWWRFLSSTDTYDPDRLEVDKELLRRFYLERGYADFSIISAIAELTPDGSRFFITFSIEEGEEYEFGTIGINSQIPDLPVEQLSPLLRGETGKSYNSQLIERSVRDLNDELGELGYAFPRIEPILNLDRETNTVDITYQIDEGQRVYVERINIEGNVRTLDEVIRREFRLAEGDAYNVQLIRRSEQRIRNLGYFESVNVSERRGSANDRVVIDVTVSERSTGELSFGAGFSTTDGALADIRLTERNLLGRGQSLTASFVVSGRRQNIELSFTEPFFLDRDLAAGFDLFRRKTDFQSESSFDETSLGGRLRAAYPLTERLRHQVRYTLRDDEIENVSNTASVFIQDEEGSRITSAVGQTLTFDARDTRFLPSEGYLLRLDQDFAGLGGDNEFISHELRADLYYSIIPDLVLNLGGGAGYIKGLFGEDVNLSNRFFIGGSTLRGFSSGGIGPRDRFTDDALGGNLYYVGTAELRFPLGAPDDLRIFGRTFVDAGTLTEIDVSGPALADSDSLRVGAGVGLSWLSPIGPLSIDVSEALVKQDEDETETFRISFGTRF